MYRPANPGKPRRASKIAILLAGALLGLTGCSHTQHAATTLGDPLLGPAPPPAQSTSPLHATTPQGSGLPPIPQNTGSNTNVGLASQPPAQSLAISQGTGWARQVDGAAKTTQATPVSSQPKVQEVPKENGITAPTTLPTVKQTGWSAASQPTAPSTDELEQQLKSRGVLAHEQAPDGSGIRLTVVIANPTNPDARETMWTTAADYATAVAAIVREIDAKRAQR
jgi:hypothetical protein